MANTPLPFTFWHPASLIATFFGVGKVRYAPGTFGSLAAFPFLYLLGTAMVALPVIKNNYEVYTRFLTLLGLMLLVVALLFAVGVWASRSYAKHTGKEDPGEIVIDEVVGQSLTSLLVLPSVFMVQDTTTMFIVANLGSFFLFRLFDIQKPWPIDWCDNNVKGGIGIMLDDIVAAFMAAILYYAMFFVGIDMIAGGK